MTTRRSFLTAASAAVATAPTLLGAKGDYLVYIGTYTNGNKSKGIHVFRFNAGTGKLEDAGLAAETANPSFVTLHPNGKLLYAVGEYNDKEKGGGLTAFSIDRKSGKLTELNKVPTKGGGPCHLVVDKTGKNVLVANYGGGSCASFPLEADGRVKEAASFIQHKGSSVDKRRQQEPHAHSINLSADNKFAFVADLGLDQVLVYKFDAKTSTLTPNDPPHAKVKPGGGPRHFALHPTQKFAYTNNEMGNAVTAFSYTAGKGVLTEIQMASTLPSDFKGTSHTAEVQVHPSGKFLYCSNRGHDSIAVFTIDQTKGTLTAVEQKKTGGRTPRNFGIDPTGAYLIAANQATDNMFVFKIDQATGKLEATGQEVACGAPVCVKFLAV